MALSCLVISRTPVLLNRMLASLTNARKSWQPGDEVLCSWNGSESDEALINPALGPSPAGVPIFRIALRQPYHFASNVNALAREARSELVLLINDDVILDPLCLDRALAVLQEHPEAGVVGGLLRTSDGRLGHAGLLLGVDHQPWNRCHPELGPMIELHNPVVQASGPIPATTGALMLLRRADLLAVPMRESFAVCGEDVALCLDLHHRLGKSAYYASTVTAVHDEKSTRGSTSDAADLVAVATLAEPLLRNDPGLSALQARWLALESDWLARLSLEQFEAAVAAERQRAQQTAAYQHDLEQRLHHWEVERQRWQLERASLISEREDLRQRLLVTWASRSWQLTKPLRLLGRISRQLAGREPR
jgi:GT2 family glycosyltransferase